MIRYETTPPVPIHTAAGQRWLRRHIATLQQLQAARIIANAQAKKAMNATVIRAQREIDNYRAQVTIS